MEWMQLVWLTNSTLPPIFYFPTRFSQQGMMRLCSRYLHFLYPHLSMEMERKSTAGAYITLYGVQMNGDFPTNFPWTFLDMGVLSGWSRVEIFIVFLLDIVHFFDPASSTLVHAFLLHWLCLDRGRTKIQGQFGESIIICYPFLLLLFRTTLKQRRSLYVSLEHRRIIPCCEKWVGK